MPTRWPSNGWRRRRAKEVSNKPIIEEIWKTVYEARHGDLGTDEATARILEIIRSDEVKDVTLHRER